MFGRKKRRMIKALADMWYNSIVDDNVRFDAKFKNHGTTLWKLKRGLGNLYKDFKAHDHDIICLYHDVAALRESRDNLQKQVDALSGSGCDRHDHD